MSTCFSLVIQLPLSIATATNLPRLGLYIHLYSKCSDFSHVELKCQTSLALTLLERMEEVDVIEQRALEASRELSVRTVDQLQTILLVVLAEFVVVPGEDCQ